MTRPVVVLSHCLANEACRYDGAAIRDPIVAALAPFVTFRPVCPEVAIGLGTPRAPVHLVVKGSGIAMVQPSTGLDVTGRMLDFSARFIGSLGPVDGFLLKARSPSCGIGETKIHDARGTRVARRGYGLFAADVLGVFLLTAAEAEDRLADGPIRDRFLCRVFASARLRAVGSEVALGRFHARYAGLLLAHDRDAMRDLERLLENEEEEPFEHILDDYREDFALALTRPVRGLRARARLTAYPPALARRLDAVAGRLA